MSYTVYGSLRSRAMRAVWCLEELGQPYEQRSMART